MNILIVSATKNEIKQDDFLTHDRIITGLGMLNTCMRLTKKLSEKHYDLVINMGIAGSFNSKFKIGDVVEVEKDIISEIGYETEDGFFEFDEFNVKTTFVNKVKTKLPKVTSITVNTVHGKNKNIIDVVQRLNPDIENMEGAAVFKVCEEFSIPCMQIRAISNKVEERNKNNWNTSLAIENLNSEIEVILALL